MLLAFLCGHPVETLCIIEEVEVEVAVAVAKEHRASVGRTMIDREGNYIVRSRVVA